MTRRFFFFNDTATTEIYTLSLHDALPIYLLFGFDGLMQAVAPAPSRHQAAGKLVDDDDLAVLHHVIDVALEDDMGAQRLVDVVEQRHVRSEEHTSELQSPDHLVCRLLLEK